MKTVVVATKNRGKVREFANFFSPYGIEVKSILDLDVDLEIEETGTTFEENALLKAMTIAKQFQCDVIADDSGLEVDALNGAPGVYSARYSGEDHNDARNNEKLIKELSHVPKEKRSARFVCALAYVTKDLDSFTVRGTVEGQIGFALQGEGGFGYDPLFYLSECDKTFAELSLSEKETISHRGRALQLLKNKLFGEKI